MKHLKIFLGLFLMTISLSLYSQDEKLRVAVFDPSSSGTAIDEGTKVAVREIISSTFVNTGKYTIVERSLLQQVMKEQKFSNTDVVDDSQATQLGKLAGANKVVLSVVTLVGGRNMLSIKVIDVKTATVDQQKTKVCQSNDLLDVVEPLTLELLGEKASMPNTASKSSSVSQQANSGSNTTVTFGEERVANYEIAQAFCKQSTKDDFNDWRLPTLKELSLMYEDSGNNSLFYGWYWSSTCVDSKCKDLRVLNMKTGRTGTAPQKKEITVRCVRVP